jgi:hypothetical protein
MNERIKQLEKQCWRSTQSEPYALFDVKKFAELIVAECAVVAHNTAEGETTYGWMVGNKILEHFGVEE